jgi:hypothetical protein
MGDNMLETNLQIFVGALTEAHGASTRVDSFDLHSEDEVSMQKWNHLLEMQNNAFRTLHEICCRIPEEDLLQEEESRQASAHG